MSKKGLIASICVLLFAIICSLLSLFNFQEIDRSGGEFIYLYSVFGVLVTLFILTIFIRKKSLFLLIPIILLFVAGYYFDFVVAINVSDYATMKDTMFTSYPTIEFVLFIAYIVALVFALMKKQKWAIITVIVYISIVIFTSIVEPVLLCDLDYVLDYMFVGFSFVVAHIGLLVYFSSMLFENKKNNIETKTEEIE